MHKFISNRLHNHMVTLHAHTNTHEPRWLIQQRPERWPTMVELFYSVPEFGGQNPANCMDVRSHLKQAVSSRIRSQKPSCSKIMDHSAPYQTIIKTNNEGCEIEARAVKNPPGLLMAYMVTMTFKLPNNTTGGDRLSLGWSSDWFLLLNFEEPLEQSR